MDMRTMITPANIVAALLTLIPLLLAAFFPHSAAKYPRRLPAWAQILCPAFLCLPYALVTLAVGQFHWGWFTLYALLPVAVAALLYQARRADAANHGNWRDFLVLATLGLAVDLRWFESAWPAHLAIFNKMMLLDAGIYGFIAIRQLDGIGFDLRLRLRDAGIGLRELAVYTPIALVMGLGLGFLHLHAGWPGLGADCRSVAVHLLLHRHSGRAFLSRLAPESSGAAHGTHSGPAFDGGSVRTLPLQQAGRAFQLALCASGCGGGCILWPGLAAGSARGRICNHPCLCGHDLVSMASVKWPDGTCVGGKSGNRGRRACCGPLARVW